MARGTCALRRVREGENSGEERKYGRKNRCVFWNRREREKETVGRDVTIVVCWFSGVGSVCVAAFVAHGILQPRELQALPDFLFP